MGIIYKFHDDLDTDQIIASQYLLLPTICEMKVHTFESLDVDFSEKVKSGDFVVGGENFGCGSSREQAPSVLKALGIKAVVAKSFARIFYRNAINIGLPVIVCRDLYDDVSTGDTMELFLSEGVVKSKGKEYICTKLPSYMQEILDKGGLIASLNEDMNCELVTSLNKNAIGCD
ncbi:MAG: 3-isopropylmalate dehydratase small subunit [Clostridioides sp.]|jgi:3-isopropylmalate dehydratase small subunit|nr:3-isopropylmalate dehydratase small subunit [Clostridioides sp.]